MRGCLLAHNSTFNPGPLFLFVNVNWRAEDRDLKTFAHEAHIKPSPSPFTVASRHNSNSKHQTPHPLQTMGDPLHDDSWSIAKGVTMSVLQNPLRTHLEVTGEEVFFAPPHWHLYHGEEHTILKGRVKLTQDGVTKILTPADGTVYTPPGVVHSLESFPGEELSMDEVAKPDDETTEQKIIFFRNMFAPGLLQSFFGTMLVFYRGDGYPEFPLGVRWIEWLFVVVVGGWIAPLLGYKLPDKRLRLDPNRFPRTKKD
ncbi:hypothetical protein C8R46DRAFT_457296 [Mycena filopes]|nr:hypothetical protein C8R46DRAFT_457296 [Mycena filopes]